jgi:hypothetical protein
MTREAVPDTKRHPESGSTEAFGDPLWAEIQALWKKRRALLDPAEYALVTMDARVFPRILGSKTRRVAHVSRDGHWVWEPVGSLVFESP